MLLAVVADGETHGYAIIQELKRRTAGSLELPEGTIYPALRRLESERLLRSRWSSDDGRRRRTYNMTARGRQELRNQIAGWRTFKAALDSILDGKHGRLSNRRVSG
jgi:DNA-binding PadR family transcriptional regulator